MNILEEINKLNDKDRFTLLKQIRAKYPNDMLIVSTPNIGGGNLLDVLKTGGFNSYRFNLLGNYECVWAEDSTEGVRLQNNIQPEEVYSKYTVTAIYRELDEDGYLIAELEVEEDD